jgi:hypothetical protein
MEILEHFLEGKVCSNTCEDGFVVTENFAAVIDGATAKADFEVENLSTGKFIMSALKDIISSLSFDCDAERCIAEIDEKLQNLYIEKGIFEIISHDNNKIPSASVIIYSKFNHELWFFGDCQALINGEFITNESRIDNLTSTMRKWMIEYLLMSGKTESDLLKNDEGREAKLFFHF